MATRWMKWDETTHIFMYSTDGVSFAPLPLNAACITEGTLNPSVIPGGSGPALAGNNTWTGVNIYSNVAPEIRFNETDQGVDLKNSDIFVNAGVLTYRTLTDAAAPIATLLTIDRSGQLKLSLTSAGIHEFAASADGANILKFTNQSAGVNAYAGITFRTDGGDFRGYVVFPSVGATISGFVANALNLFSSTAGGVVVRANAGPVVLNTSGADRLTISSGGAITIASTVNAVNGYLERNRSVPIGEKINITVVPTDFTGSGSMTWTVTSANVINYHYEITGKKVTFTFDFYNMGVGGTVNTALIVKLPAALAGAVTFTPMPVWVNNPGGILGITYPTAAGYIYIYKDATLGSNWVAAANGIRISFVQILWLP